MICKCHRWHSGIKKLSRKPYHNCQRSAPIPINSWKENLIFEQESFELLEDILDSAGELEERVPYEELVTTEFAEQAAEK